ncbi:MAG: ketopantoate reductase family protein [Oscillospiraceae bacterium]|nr:ketopantoate reductase family protein [Oscillospiraceae bacterium]
MKYLIIGAGGTGGCLAGFMADGGLDVSVVEKRSDHLAAMKANGLTVQTDFRGTFNVPIKAFGEDEYNDKPDVIIVCVKSYSLDEIVPFIREKMRPGTIIIPICNMFDTGIVLQNKLTEMNVMDGCVYVSASVEAPGVVRMYGQILSLVYGVRELDMYTRFLDKIAFDLRMCGIEGTVSDTIMLESLKKFSFASPLDACTLHYRCRLKNLQHEGEEREMFTTLIREIELMGKTMGLELKGDVVATNLGILDNLEPESTSYVIRDIESGSETEVDGLIFEVLRRCKAINLELPTYRMIAEEAGYVD